MTTDRELELLSQRLGITNIVPRATATAAELRKEELILGRQELETKVIKFKPKWLAVLGVSAYRTAFEAPKAKLGLQPDKIGETPVWVLPNPSGLNAHFTPKKLAELFRRFKEVVERRERVINR